MTGVQCRLKAVMLQWLQQQPKPPMRCEYDCFVANLGSIAGANDSLFRYELLDVIHPQLVLHCDGITLQWASEQAWVIYLLQQRLTAGRHAAKVAVAGL
jgi:hypothetical protein